MLIQILLFLLLTAADRYTKYLADTHLKNGSGIRVIPSVLDFQYLENTGAAFGLLKDRIWLFFVISIFVFVILVILYCRIYHGLKRYIQLNSTFHRRTYLQFVILGYLLVILGSGAAGNLIDRIFYGYVIDFIRVTFISFPVFNVADICVTGSVVFLILYFLFIYREDEDLKLFEKNSSKNDQ